MNLYREIRRWENEISNYGENGRRLGGGGSGASVTRVDLVQICMITA
jgi:hypothetical protein